MWTNSSISGSTAPARRNSRSAIPTMTRSNHIDLSVKQVQKVEGLVGLFDVPVDVEIATATGHKTFPIRVSQASQTFTFPVDGAPLMVIFDKGDQILKSIDFKKSTAELVYQLNTCGDRARPRGRRRGTRKPERRRRRGGRAGRRRAPRSVLGNSQSESLRALGRIGGAAAETPIVAAVERSKTLGARCGGGPAGTFQGRWFASFAVNGNCGEGSAYRVRAAALSALASNPRSRMHTIRWWQR